MSLRWALVAVAGLFALAGESHESSAGVLAWITRDAAAGIEPALGRTLADVDTRLASHENRIGNLLSGVIGQTSDELGTRLTQIDGIVEKRLLQVNLGVNDILDHGLDKIDGVARRRLAQVDRALEARIDQVDEKISKQLNAADEILKNRIDDVGRVVTGAVNQADGALTARIEQLDEVAGRRLGNVDVIASKQRLGLERTITRAAWLIGLVVFVIVVLRALWLEYLAGEKKIREARPGRERAWLTLTLLAKPLAKHGAVAAAVAVLLATVPERLPMAAVKEQQALIQRHATDLEASLARLDWTRVRFHASQLEFLEPENAARYQAMAARAELLRDVLEKPTALATTAGVTAVLAKVQAVERLQAGRPDPDARTVRAMILWQRGNTRQQEHEAATLAARALWSTPRGFTLAPMARLLVEAYLHAPAPEDRATRAPQESGEPQDAVEGLAATLDLTAPAAPGTPFEGAATLFHLMQALDERSTPAFVEMVEAQAKVTQLAGGKARGKDDAAGSPLAKELARRNNAAERVVAAWQDFDQALLETPVLSANPLVLGVFRLNDVILTHALWYTTQPRTTDWPKSLASLKGADERWLKLALAPARAVWARRYAAMLQGPARELVELQEAQRFEEKEREVLAFEQAYGAFSTEAAAQPSLDLARDLRRLKVAQTAADLGIYEGKGATRKPLAEKIAGSLADLQKRVDAGLKKTRTDIDAKLSKVETGATDKLNEKVEDALRSLRGKLLGRSSRLI